MTEPGHFAVVFDVLDRDVETLVRGVARSRRVLLVSDARSPKVESLQREVGAGLLVASHRLIDSGHGLRHSDFDLAAQIAGVHARNPLEAIIYASDAIVDFAWFEAALLDVPRGRLLKGRLAYSDQILGDSHLFAESGPTVVALWGDAATSDFTMTCRPSVGLLSWVGVTQMTPTVSEWTADMATVLDGQGLAIGDLVTETIEISSQTDGVIFILVSDAGQGVALHASLSEAVAGRLLVGTPADSWLSGIIGEEGLASVDSIADRLVGFEPVRRETPDAEVAIVDDMDELGEILDRMNATDSTEVLVAAARSQSLADAMVDKRVLSADLGFMAAHRVPMGDLDPSRIRDDVVSIGPRARRVARLAADASPDFHTLVFRLSEPSLTTSAIIGLVPDMDGPHPGALRTTRSPLDLGLRLTPPLLPLPNVPAEPHPPPPEVFDPKSWVGRLGWSTRTRLALPWRWNLLPRAMRDRW